MAMKTYSSLLVSNTHILDALNTRHYSGYYFLGSHMCAHQYLILRLGHNKSAYKQSV